MRDEGRERERVGRGSRKDGKLKERRKRAKGRWAVDDKERKRWR